MKDYRGSNGIGASPELNYITDKAANMKTKHTPGPWTAQPPRGHQHAIDRKWEIVAKIPDGGEFIVVGEHTGIDCLKESDARLIALAPEMLEALQYISEGGESWKDCCRLARAILAKLDGGNA